MEKLSAREYPISRALTWEIRTAERDIHVGLQIE